MRMASTIVWILVGIALVTAPGCKESSRSEGDMPDTTKARLLYSENLELKDQIQALEAALVAAQEELAECEKQKQLITTQKTEEVIKVMEQIAPDIELMQNLQKENAELKAEIARLKAAQ